MFILSGMTLSLLIAALIVNITMPLTSWFIFPQLILISAFLYESNRERINELKFKTFNFEAKDFFSFAAVLSAAIVTFIISHYLETGPVVAAGLVGVISTLVIPKFDVPAYCGAFVGMSCNTVFVTFEQLVLAGIIAGLIFVLSKNVFNGFGGKLGTIAFASCIAMRGLVDIVGSHGIRGVTCKPFIVK